MTSQLLWVRNVGTLGPLLRLLSQAVIKVTPGPGAHLKVALGKALLPGSLVTGRISFPESCWTEGLRS